MKRVTILMFLCSFFGHSMRAQDRIQIGGFLGSAGYLGDLNKSDWFSKEPHLAYGACVKYVVSPSFDWRVSFLQGRFSGRDSNYPDRAFRNFSTSAYMHEFSSQIEWNIIPIHRHPNPQYFVPQLTPYIFVGFGITYTQPNADFENMIVAKAEFVEGAYTDRLTVYTPYFRNIPFGLGLKYQFTNEWILTIDAGFRMTFSDYLDGISHGGNPNKTDRYKFSGIGIHYRFPKNPTKCHIRFNY